MSHPQFSVVLNDPADAGGALDSALVSDMQAAANAWAPELSGTGTLTISFSVASLGDATELAEGAPTTLERTGQTLDGRAVVQTASAYALSTGRAAAGSSDITITVNADVLGKLYTGTSGPVPSGQYDAVSILEHEIAHGLGFTGEIAASGLRGGSETLYDHYVQVAADGSIVFTGPNAERVNGGPVTLTVLNNGENFYHLADSAADPNADDLMSGLGLPAGTVRGISALDLAILEDTGLPVSGTAVVAATGPVVVTLAGASAAAGYTGDGGADVVLAQASTGVTGAATGSMTVFATAGTLAFANGGGASTVVDAGAVALNLAGGSAGSQLVAFTDAAATSYRGGGGTDELIGGSGALSLTGGKAGSLVAFGGSGTLQLLGGTDSETIIGGAGAATIHAGPGAVFGGTGGSVMAAMQPGSFLAGAVGGDVLNASSAGGDILAAGAGNETLNGAGAAEIDIFFGGNVADQVRSEECRLGK